MTKKRNERVIHKTAAPLVSTSVGFLGIKLSKTRNATNAAVISTEKSRATVRVIRTDEELVIAKSVIGVLKLNVAKKGIKR